MTFSRKTAYSISSKGPNSGATLVEYMLLILLMVIVVLVAVPTIGSYASQAFTEVGTAMS